MPEIAWPEALFVVRHGESAGNVARERAEAAAQDRIEIDQRDVDVPLSDEGRRQAEALGEWLLEQPEDRRPTLLLVSPYVRAVQTAEVALEKAGMKLPTVVDERFREREFGVLDGLTKQGISSVFPEEQERRQRLGKFYHRPPGGESWSDVLLRLRAGLSDVRRDHPGERILLVAHQVVVLLVRYVVEELDERQILDIDADAEVANCSVTSYEYDEEQGRLRLVRFNEVDHVRAESDADVTAEPDEASGRP